MRHAFLLFFFLFANFFLHAQGDVRQAGQSNGNVYAIIVGISSYENTGIPALSFAHKDAEVFNEYLQSKAGGAVPQENIRMLLNEKATYAAIYDGLSWLLETCKENDLVYFYFSGHGDMENTTIYKLGFLLSYNSPRTNYLNSAVRIEDLNNFANTLSIKSKTKVVLITDACHSGDLAGKNFRASMLVGQQLRAYKEKEIRITSCAPEQLSVEDEGWGGGRGVFSYYLIRGLQGQADLQKDGAVTVNEIKIYLDSMMATDALLAQKAHVQNPAITGNYTFTISLVDKAFASTTSQSENTPPPNVFLKPLAKSPQSYFFDALESRKVEEVYDFTLLSTYTAEKIPFAILAMSVDSSRQIISQDQFNQIDQSLRQNPDALKKFNNKLVVLLSDRGQEVINDYLEGDEAELEKRRYYNSNVSNYDAYPKMFEVALKLAQPGSYLADILKVKQNYFTGLAVRLKMPLVKEQSGLVAQALRSQLQAFTLEKNAAYINNELGVLYSAKDDLQKAEKYFKRATEIAPEWSIPWSNLSGLYLERKQLEKSMNATNRSLTLQSGNQGAVLSLGLIYEAKNNLLLAEEFFRTSIELNTRHYFPFERLAYTYLKTTDYALADSFFYEADLRKQGFHFQKPKHMKFPNVYSEVSKVKTDCYFNTLDIKPDDVLGNFAWGITLMSGAKVKEAEEKFRNVLRTDSTNPLAWHYLGKVLYDQHRWLESEVMFKHAIQSYMDSSMFEGYLQKIGAINQHDAKDCFILMFKENYYEAVEDRYLLAAVFENFYHLTAAETAYKDIIRTTPFFIGGYQKLWTLYEKLGRYADAEEVLKDYRHVNMVQGEEALYSFYKRMITKFPEDKTAYYRAANFLYALVAVKPELYARDHKTILADSDEEVLVKGPFVPGYRVPVNLPGTGEELPVIPVITQPFTDGISYFLVADSLYEEDDLRAEINQKTGDLYVWQGLSKKAILHYKKSSALQPYNADTRIKLIKTSAQNYKLGDALAELDSLHLRNQLNYEMQLLYAKYTMHASRFDDAVEILRTGMAVYPYETHHTLALQARLHMLQQKPKQALLIYQKLLSLQPEDPSTLYSIASLYAKMHDEAKAFQTLKESIDKGFNYAWIVKNDDSWKSYRNKNNWKDLIAKMSPKVY